MARWIIGVVVAAVAAVVAIVIVAGGGSDDSADASAPPGVDTEQLEAFRACLSEQGVDESEMPIGPQAAPPTTDDAPSGSDDQFQAPSGSELPQPSEEMQTAMQACQDLMPTPPSGVPGDGGPQVFTAPPQE